MKKISSILVTFIILFSFSFNSCASKDAENQIDEIEAPAVEEIIPEIAESSETQEIEKTEENIEPEEEPSETIEKITDELEENPQNFLIPDELQEPDVFEEEVIEAEEIPEISPSENESESEISEQINPDELDEIDDVLNFNDDGLENTDFEDDIIVLVDETTFENQDEATDDVEILSENNSTEISSDENPIQEINSDTTFENENEISINVDLEETSDDKETEDVFPDEIIIPSRKVTLKRGEYLDVIYPGNGWIYVGVTDGSKDVTYNGRKLGTENTTFTLIGKNPGTKIVHFYKTDNLTGEYIDDYLEIEILNERTTSKVHQIAPDYSQIVPIQPKNKRNEINENVNIQNKAETSENNSDDDIVFLEETTSSKKTEIPSVKNENLIEKNIISPQPKEEQTSSDTLKNDISTVDSETLLKDAKIAFNEKNYESALNLLDEYTKISSKKLDEVYFLMGQSYEAQSGIQNINNAVEEYEKIIKLYPSSKYWDKANKRIIYLKRFYLEVR